MKNGLLILRERGHPGARWGGTHRPASRLPRGRILREARKLESGCSQRQGEGGGRGADRHEPRRTSDEISPAPELLYESQDHRALAGRGRLLGRPQSERRSQPARAEAGGAGLRLDEPCPERSRRDRRQGPDVSGCRGVARNRLWREVTAEADIQRFYDEKVVTRPATSLRRKIAKGALLPGSIHVGPPGWKSAS